MTLSAQSCLNRLHERDCLEYCMVLENKCNDNDKVIHCQRKFHQNMLDYPNIPDVHNIPKECRCLLRAPETREEEKEHKANLQNRACWSKFCVNEGAPRAGQLIKNTWWNDRPNCKNITHCVLDMDETGFDLADNAQLNLNNCGEKETITSNDTTNTENTPEGNTNDNNTNDKNTANTDKWQVWILANTDKWQVWILAVVIIVMFVLMINK